MSDLYHLLLQARLDRRQNLEDDTTRKEAVRHLQHVMALALEAGLVQVQVLSKDGDDFAIMEPEALSTDLELGAVIVGAKKVFGHTQALPQLRCEGDHCTHDAQGTDRLAAAATAMSYAFHPEVVSGLAELRQVARECVQPDVAQKIEALAQRLDQRLPEI